VITIDEFIASPAFRPGALLTDAGLVRSTFSAPKTSQTVLYALIPAVGEAPSSDQLTWHAEDGPSANAASALWSAAAGMELVNDPILSSFATERYIDATTGQWTSSFRQEPFFAEVSDLLALKAEDNLMRTHDLVVSLEKASANAPGGAEKFSIGGLFGEAVKGVVRSASWDTARVVGWWVTKEAVGGIVGQLAISGAEWAYHRYETDQLEQERKEQLQRREQRRHQQGHQAIQRSSLGIAELLAAVPASSLASDGSLSTAGWELANADGLGGYAIEQRLIAPSSTPPANEPDALSRSFALHR